MRSVRRLLHPTMIRTANQAMAMPSWNIFHAVVASGDTYVFDPRMPREQALAYWLRSDTHTYVADSEARWWAPISFKPNNRLLAPTSRTPASWSSPTARRLGVGRRMGEHSLAEARRLGFRAMQFNLVVSTNEGAVRRGSSLAFRLLAPYRKPFDTLDKALSMLT